MTIEEAIKAFREPAEKSRTIGKSLLDRLNDKKGSDWYEKHAKEHEQLAEWLEELVVLRKAYELACNEIEVIPEFFIYNAKEKLQDDKR